MPGLVGRFTSLPGPDAGLADALRRDHPDVAWNIHRDEAPLSLLSEPGHGGRTNHVSQAGDASDFVCLWGHCFDTATRRQLQAEDLLVLLKSEGLDVLTRLEGGFHLVWHAIDRQQLHLINDRLGMLPLYLHTTEKALIFGFRPRFLSPLLTDKRPEPAGVISFLSIGYCLGSRSLLQGVDVLLPATILTWDIRCGRSESRQYWDLQYREDPAATIPGLCDELHDAILDSVDLLAAGGQGNSGLFLSGGWDCRAILGAQLSRNLPPHAVITNGKSDQLKGSDTALARRLAGDLGLNYRFCRRDPEIAAQECLQGILQCELVTDTAPEVFGQIHPPEGTFTGLDYVFKGDEIWGWQDEAVDRTTAVANVMPTHLSANLLASLNAARRTEAEGIFQQEIDAVLSGCDSTDWNEIKDYLYLKGRVTRYILGLGSSDEEHVQVRRPFFTVEVIDVIQRIRNRWRVQKNLFIEMLARHQHKLFAYRRNHTSHIANYYAYMADAIREAGPRLNREDHPLRDVLDLQAAADRLSTFNVVRNPADSGGLGPVARLRNLILDRWGHLWYRSDFYRRRSLKRDRRWSCSDNALTFRIFLLAEYFAHDLKGEPVIRD